MPLKQKKSPMSLDEAETLAIQVLAFLAEDGARFSRFTALTGIDISDLRAEPPSRLPLAAVIEYPMGDESLLLMFSAEARGDPADIAPALAILSAPAGPRYRG